MINQNHQWKGEQTHRPTPKKRKKKKKEQCHWEHWLCSDWAGTLRSLVWLLILLSRTETMRWLDLNLCCVFQFSTPPTTCPQRCHLLLSWWEPPHHQPADQPRGRSAVCGVCVTLGSRFYDIWCLLTDGSSRGRIGIHLSGAKQMKSLWLNILFYL